MRLNQSPRPRAPLISSSGHFTLDLDTGQEFLNVFVKIAALGVEGISHAVNAVTESIAKVISHLPWNRRRDLEERLQVFNTTSVDSMISAVSAVELLCKGHRSEKQEIDALAWPHVFESAVEKYADELLSASHNIVETLDGVSEDAEVRDAVSALLHDMAHRAYTAVEDAAMEAHRTGCHQAPLSHSDDPLHALERRSAPMLDHHFLSRRRRAVEMAAVRAVKKSVRLVGGVRANATIELAVNGKLSKALTQPLTIFEVGIPGASIYIPKVSASSARVL